MKRLLTLAIFVFTIVLSVGAQEVTPNTAPFATTKGGSAITKLNGQQKTNNAKQKDYGQSPIPSCDGCFNSYSVEQPHAKTKEQESKEASLDRLYRRYLWATIIGVFGGFIGIGILIWQAIITRTAANAAKASADALVNSERAWLVVIDVGIPHGLQKNKRGWITMGFGFDWTVKNCGNTPAFITKIGARFHCVQDLAELPEEPNIDVDGLVQPTDYYSEGLSVGPGETIERFTLIPRERRYAVPNDICIAYGVVEYKLTFPNFGTRETRFCYIWTPGAQESMLRSPKPPKYTKQT
jgi:hypothetical protein